ncbi:uncharacterized protein [Gossypium hirsutum]|uniref:RNase H type-1 domain-containing protein n=1 Tax=Gossypium hirsutum TaxID=3635 RepID=A0ABM2ZNF7_GOSHI|nr:uncharacterized protein LOC121214494 [Gossypium hirsutum]
MSCYNISVHKYVQENQMGFLQWLFWDFTQSSASQRRTFCVAVRAIWGDRNNRLHNKGSKSGIEIGRFVNSYILELDSVGKNSRQTSITVKKWKKPMDSFVKINFDAAYERGQNKADIGVVARDKEGSVLLSCSEVHQRVSSAFGAEAIACRKALQIGVHMQWERVIIEGDSLSIIKKYKTKKPR